MWLQNHCFSASYDSTHEGGCLGQAVEHAMGFTTLPIEEEDELFTYVDDEEDKLPMEAKDDLSFAETKSVHNVSTTATEPYSVKAETFWSNMLKLLQWEKSAQEKIKTKKVSE